MFWVILSNHLLCLNSLKYCFLRISRTWEFPDHQSLFSSQPPVILKYSYIRKSWFFLILPYIRWMMGNHRVRRNPPGHLVQSPAWIRKSSFSIYSRCLLSSCSFPVRENLPFLMVICSSYQLHQRVNSSHLFLS